MHTAPAIEPIIDHMIAINPDRTLNKKTNVIYTSGMIKNTVASANPHKKAIALFQSESINL